MSKLKVFFIFLAIFGVYYSLEKVSALELPTGTPVKVLVPIDRMPPAEFELVPKGAKVTKPDTCLDASGKLVFAKNPKSFNTNWSNTAKCAQSIVDATTIDNKIKDLKASIAVIKKFTDSLQQSKNEIRQLTSLDDTSFVIIPGGVKQEKIYEHTSGVAFKCVAGAGTLLGSALQVKGSSYIENSPQIDSETKIVKQKINKGHQDFKKEDASDRGAVTSGTINRLSLINEILSKNFILITANAYNKHYESADGVIKNAIPLSVALEEGEGTKKKLCTSYSSGASLKLSIAGIEKSFITSTITLDGNIFDPECIPEVFLLTELKNGITKNITYFEKLKAEYEALLVPLEKQLATLKKASYYCGDSVNIASTNQPQKLKSKSKSVGLQSILPPDRNSNGTTTTGSTPSPSLLQNLTNLFIPPQPSPAADPLPVESLPPQAPASSGGTIAVPPLPLPPPAPIPTSSQVTINPWNVYTSHTGTVANATPSSNTNFSTIFYALNFTGGPTDGDKRVFVHFVDSSGNIKFSSDISPATPSSKWTASSSNWVSTEVEIPENTPTGTYSVYAGLYSGNDRVKLNSGPGVLGDNQTRYKVGTVIITPIPVTSKNIWSMLTADVFSAVVSALGY